MNIMIFDDDPQVLALMQRSIQRKGHAVLVYENPLECPLSKVNFRTREPALACPDIIICDFNMPGMNGVEFMEELHDRGCPCRNFALMTGGGLDESEWIRTARLGTRLFIKPVNFTELFSWMDGVARALDGNGPDCHA